jgi:hypothetical protein
MDNDKVIVTNFAALRAKYQSAGLTTIQEALKALIAKDKTEGLKTVVVDLSSAAQMGKLKGNAVTKPLDQRQVKAAIDAIYKAVIPAYLMILGAQDVVPLQDLTNPVGDPDAGDPDPVVPSDLPYACDAGYSKDPARFIGPTRVVGRLPDIVGASRPDSLVKLIKIASARTSRPPEDYASHFSVTAWEWKGSTRKSLEKLFGAGKKAHNCPKKGPAWDDPHLAARAHFINCHGSASRPMFHGQQGESYPVAHESRLLTGKISEGTVAAVECCYGAELYNPENSGKLMGICYGYLLNGAYGYCGSTNVAYGPAEDNGQADLLCQYFLKRALAGASLGRAMLEARQQFAQGTAQLDPYDLKTLVQFTLLGDPSIHPVAKKSATTAVAKGAATAASFSERTLNRLDRRRLLVRIGETISQTQLVAKRIAAGKPAAGLARKLKDLAAKAGLKDGHVLSFNIEGADEEQPRAKSRSILASLPAPEAFHVIAERRRGVDEQDVAVVGICAREVNGEIVSYKKVVSR